MPVETGALSTVASGRLAGVMFMVSGVVTSLSMLLPSPPDLDKGHVVVIGLLAFVAGLGWLMVPWHRLPARTAFLLAGPAAGVLISFHNYYGGSDPYRYSIFYAVLFVWIGLTQPPKSGLYALPLLAISYLTPLLLKHDPSWALGSAVMVIPVMVLIAESISWVGKRVTVAKTELVRLAGTDPLTGLDNRTSLYRKFSEQLSNPRRAPGALGVFFLDLDGFKTINDTLGHEIGDLLLVEVAARLRAAARLDDTIARIGGDEFVLMADSLLDMGEAVALGDRIMAEMQRPFELREFSLGLTVSVGVALAGDGSVGLDQLLTESDTAMYSAKRSGGGRVSVAALAPVA
jgi:diguanylate cyclase (GGDEF)-like protein